MSWTNVGPQVDLAPGQSVGWWYVWPNGADQGLQLAGPNILLPGPGHLGTLVASSQGKQIDGINQVTYVVTITNTDPTEHGVHNLQGGGVS